MQAIKNLLLFVLVAVFGMALIQSEYSLGLVVVLIISAIFSYDSNSEAKKSHKVTEENAKHIQGLRDTLTQTDKHLDTNLKVIEDNFQKGEQHVEDLYKLITKLTVIVIKQELEIKEIKNAKRQPRGKSTTKNS